MKRDNIEAIAVDEVTRGETTVYLKEYKSGRAGEKTVVYL